jgi:hypothetical protein
MKLKSRVNKTLKRILNKSDIRIWAGFWHEIGPVSVSLDNTAMEHRVPLNAGELLDCMDNYKLLKRGL